MRSATYLRSYWGKQSVITVGKAMTSQQGGGQQPAGIRDVARLAGVSVASVSIRALNVLAASVLHSWLDAAILHP